MKKTSENIAFTAKENIVLDRPEEQELSQLLKQVGLWDAIEKLPQKENTYLSKLFEPEGIELSGGQSQRLAIARALYREAPLLVLDEPTSALDPLAEEEIFRCFQEISQGKTAVMISHRLSSTKLCDRILVLQEGKILEDGSHRQLMAIENGVYKTLFETQAAYYREKE